MSDNSIFLKDYQAPAFEIERIDLAFALHDDHATVENQMQIKRLRPGPLRLDGDELELLRVEMNGQRLSRRSLRLTEKSLELDDCPDEFKLTIVTRIRPQSNTQLSGLYRSRELFCTQCEAEGFRRITFFPDRPDVLTRFSTRISADKTKYPVLLSNGNLLASGDEEDGRHWVLWEDPFKKPSYLFALVAGDLACVRDSFVTCSGRTVDLRIYVEPGNEDKCDHAMQSLKKAMRWDEEVYGREYDLSIFMIVAVSDFNMGAMENKGLNIFNSKYILARSDTATDQDYADIEGVVAHEYFHNWTGNRVTCRDWFQLSLKEGLTVFRDQEFSRDMNSRDVNRILDVKLLRAAQFPEDAGAMAHPVRPESYQEINNFYTATIYNKGAEVIRMQHTLLGSDGFRRGMDLYFERHDGQAVTIDDFVAAMEDANQVDFSQLTRWYSQAGTPEVTAQTEFENGVLTLTLSQSCPPTPECQDKQPFHIPIRMALFDEVGRRIPLEKEVLELREQTQQFTFPGLKVRPVLSLLRDFSAPIILHHSMTQSERLSLLRFETNGFAKWDAAQRLALDNISAFLENTGQDHINPDLIGAFSGILLDESLDTALRADLLTPPGFEDVAVTLDRVDVLAVEAARNRYRRQLGGALYELAESTYQRLWALEKGARNGAAYGQRKLRNLCLWLMMKADEARAMPLCQQQFNTAVTMTDQIASFALLVNSSVAEVSQQAIERFYRQWSADELVLDKWFAIQATSERPGTLTQVKQLLNHPAFSLKNPNKVRALIGAFCQSNPEQFHAVDGQGYAFLSDMLITMDGINPQIAARLATPFTRWHRFDEARQRAMLAQLRILSERALSPDLSEMVFKSLRQDAPA
ncbi:aminopeptidase N [Legionella sp. CNM-4043-24]|uniref:aminopeptidase N n=1 Tax=Legionella sp. CNM-4043-24 TaxID=3421646 RepID=UPI00403AEE61